MAHQIHEVTQGLLIPSGGVRVNFTRIINISDFFVMRFLLDAFYVDGDIEFYPHKVTDIALSVRRLVPYYYHTRSTVRRDRAYGWGYENVHVRQISGITSNIGRGTGDLRLLFNEVRAQYLTLSMFFLTHPSNDDLDHPATLGEIRNLRGVFLSHNNNDDRVNLYLKDIYIS